MELETDETIKNVQYAQPVAAKVKTFMKILITLPALLVNLLVHMKILYLEVLIICMMLRK